MTEPVADRTAMISGMRPHLDDARYVFVSGADHLADAAIASIREDEGLSLVVPAALAPGAPPMARITLQVHSALEGVGLTAAVSSCLADQGIACNMVAGFHHDHLFVLAADGERALALLLALQARTST